MRRVVEWLTWIGFQWVIIGVSFAKPPNILIFLADDLGYADLDWKDRTLHTPNLREYAFADGTAYLTNSYVLHLCTPTRSSLMTGYYPFRTGTQNGVFLPMERSGVPLDFPFLPQHLSKAGYRNYLIGKWHLGNCKRDFLPTARGFDYFYGYYSAQEGYFNHSLAFYDKHTDSMVGGLDLFTEVKGRPVPDYTKNGVYATNLFTDEAIRVMSQHNRRDPFFMFLSHQSVHAPLQVPMQYRAFCNPLIMSKARHIYCGMLASLDESFGQVIKRLSARYLYNIGIKDLESPKTGVGRLSIPHRLPLKFLKESGLYDDTIIIFSSDNGGDPKAGASNLPLKGAKSSVWEGGCKTTTFIHSPKHISGFGIRKDLFHVVDWHATLLGAAGVSLPKYGDGINQWPMITTGKSVGLRRSQMVYNINPPLSALRNNDFKLVYESKGSVVTAGGRARLYHLPSDPFETRDIARQQPKLVRKLVKRLLEFQSVARSSVRTPIDPAGHPMRFGGAFTTGWCK